MMNLIPIYLVTMMMMIVAVMIGENLSLVVHQLPYKKKKKALIVKA